MQDNGMGLLMFLGIADCKHIDQTQTTSYYFLFAGVRLGGTYSTICLVLSGNTVLCLLKSKLGYLKIFNDINEYVGIIALMFGGKHTFSVTNYIFRLRYTNRVLVRAKKSMASFKCYASNNTTNNTSGLVVDFLNES